MCASARAFGAVLGIVTRTLGGCSEPPVTGEPCGLRPGDVVVTELMIDPPGADGSGEWLELHDTTAEPLSLSRVVLAVTGRSRRTWEVRGAVSIEAHGYWVAGNDANGAAPVDASYDSALDLPNAGATVTVECNGAIVDSVSYGTSGGPPAPPAGHSLALDGGLAPDGALGDDPAAWCPGSDAYDAESFGTPGGPNPGCGTVTCDDAGTVRSVRRPGPGALVVSEVFARSGKSPATHDWLELYAAGPDPVDVNGLEVSSTSTTTGSTSRATLAAEACIGVEPGALVVVGGALDPTLTGGVPVQVAAPSLSLGNEAPLVIELWAGDTLVDRASVPAAVSGKSASLDVAHPTAAANDDPGAFCASEAAGLFAESGTPGRPNLCGPTCLDGGVPRAVRTPAPGDLVVTEVFPDPAGSDGGRDWMELVALADVDLNRLSVEARPAGGSPSAWALAPRATDGCVAVAAGVPVVVGGTGAALLGVDVALTIGGASDGLLPSSAGGDVSLRVALGDTPIDEITYPPSGTAAGARLHPGRSWALDARDTSAAGNDAPATWCESTSAAPGFGGASGTPGLVNPDPCY